MRFGRFEQSNRDFVQLLPRRKFSNCLASVWYIIITYPPLRDDRCGEVAADFRRGFFWHMINKGSFPDKEQCALVVFGPTGGNWEDEYYLFRDEDDSPVVWLWKAAAGQWRKSFWSREIPSAEWDRIEVDGKPLRMYVERALASKGKPFGN